MISDSLQSHLHLIVLHNAQIYQGVIHGDAAHLCFLGPVISKALPNLGDPRAHKKILDSSLRSALEVVKASHRVDNQVRCRLKFLFLGLDHFYHEVGLFLCSV